MLNTRNEAKNTNTVFYSYLACFVNTCTLNLNMHVSMSYSGLTRRKTRNTLFIFIFVWLRHEEYVNIYSTRRPPTNQASNCARSNTVGGGGDGGVINPRLSLYKMLFRVRVNRVNPNPPTDPPCLCHKPYNIGDGNIV